MKGVPRMFWRRKKPVLQEEVTDFISARDYSHPVR